MAILIRLRAYLRRPVRFGSVLASYLGIILIAAYTWGVVTHEGHLRVHDLCSVVVNVHESAQFRALTEHENLQATYEFLADPENQRESPALYDRVRDNLKIARQRVRQADQDVLATSIPPTCEPYAKEPHNNGHR